MRKQVLAVLSALMIIFLFALSSSAAEPKAGGRLVVGIESDLKQLDPHKGRTAIEGRTFSMICDNLVEGTKDYKPGPGLAVSWKVSSDGMEWIFHLRQGVKFHNGREFTAEDVKWNMERIMDPETKAASRSRFANVQAVEAVDRYTIKFVMKNPAGGLLAAFFGSGVQAPLVAPECVGEDGNISHPIGTGPFKFVEWKANEHVKVVKFEEYWDKPRPYLEEVILKPVPDEMVRLTALRSGDVDVTYLLPMDEIAKLMKKPSDKYKFDLSAQGSTVFIHFNLSKPPFDNVKVRQAVAYGIDKEELLIGVDQGYGEAVNQAFPKASQWYLDVPEIGRDINKAKGLLKSAGYPDGLDIALTTSNTYPQMLATGQILQEQLKAIGMRIKLDISDWPTFVGKAVKGNFTMAVAGWAAIADPTILYPAAFVPKGTYSFLVGNAYDNPKMTEAVQKGEQASQPGERKKHYTEAVKILVEEAPWIFTTLGTMPFGWQSYVKGFEPQKNGIFAYSGGGFQYVWLNK